MTTAATIDKDLDDGVLAMAAGLAVACGVSEERTAAAFGDQAASVGRRTGRSGLLPVLSTWCDAMGAGRLRDPHVIVDKTTDIERRVRAAGGGGTFSLASSLAGELIARAAYDAGSTVARGIAAQVEVANFHAIRSVALEQTAPFSRVSGTGELPMAGLDDERAGTVRLGTSGVALRIPRQVLVDNNAPALAKVFQDLGARAALAVDYELFKNAVMEGSDVFYTSANANRLTGSGLSSTTLGAAETLLWSQCDKHKRPLGVRPAALLLPPELVHVGRGLLGAQPAGNAALRLLVSPLLSLSTMPGYSPTTWYLAADPTSSVVPFQLTTLAGRPGPTVEAGAMDATGVEMRAFFDFACTAVDPRGAAKVTA